MLGMHFDPVPPAALPVRVFGPKHAFEANGESIELAWAPPAHTDTDIVVHYKNSNVLHLGDLFFNGTYPFIDASTGGNIGGLIAAAGHALPLADGKTKIVPGHGPLGDKPALERYVSMLREVRDRVKKLKDSGKSAEEVVAAKPTADLDSTWGKSFMPPDMFVGIVYATL